MATLPQHFNIVALETYLTGTPPPFTVPAPHTCSFTNYDRSTPQQAAERLRDADIAVVVVLPLTADVLSETATPRLKCIAVMASGTDAIDLDACRRRGIRVLNSPNCNTPAVAAHALSLFLACRRRLLPAMDRLVAGQWPVHGTLAHRTVSTPGLPPPGFPRGLSDETVVIVGYGAVGQQVAALFRALGVAAVLVSGRKGVVAGAAAAAAAAAGTDLGGEGGRVPFAEGLRRATVLVVCCPRTPETMGLLGAAEFDALSHADCLLINVSRGGVVDEEALVAALKAHKLGGAGVDVFAQEPASAETSVLVAAAGADAGLNVIVTPHTAWVAEGTYRSYHEVVKSNVWDFVAGTVKEERIKA